MIKELKAVEIKMSSLLDLGKFAERNQLQKQWIELRKSIDYGYEVGQVVEYLKGVRDWKQGRILSISDTWQIEFYDVVVPVELVRPIYEEMTLF